ncbi:MULTISPECIES: lipoyl domain-containing protein [unclassified Pseudofrankia]|uniref:lipoyl domain-containing protein n=1 Tax=unclassified Pseudofrankia TaxID=2994372 RepID=UPI0008D9B4F2|nr:MULTISPECIES: biotin/lipoyl-containing protein [unclassified Pseudofrankia]MDT3442836.1 biotin/lipoyl-containing protein [Pseudofrankia sp. BMG5.37]OHV74323.1 dihydrolipoamide acyltransferase [Pseudofrankia sp. BMG5.36]
MAEFTIRIPRVSVAISEAELIDLLVAEGAHVQQGEPLFIIATDKAETEVEAGASGTVHWTGTLETVYEIGAEIGEIRPAG